MEALRFKSLKLDFQLRVDDEAFLAMVDDDAYTEEAFGKFQCLFDGAVLDGSSCTFFDFTVDPCFHIFDDLVEHEALVLGLGIAGLGYFAFQMYRIRGDHFKLRFDALEYT